MSWLVNALLIMSALLIFGSSMGAVRFPSAITRLHAMAKAGGLAATLLLIVVLIERPDVTLLDKVILIIVMILFTTAQTAHIIARSSIAGSAIHPYEDTFYFDDGSMDAEKTVTREDLIL